MTTLKDIFDKIGEKKWEKGENPHYSVPDTIIIYSLPDLLANKSWCQAVWEKCECDPYGSTCTSCKYVTWKVLSLGSFEILRDRGIQACLDFILKTML